MNNLTNSYDVLFEDLISCITTSQLDFETLKRKSNSQLNEPTEKKLWLTKETSKNSIKKCLDLTNWSPNHSGNTQSSGNRSRSFELFIDEICTPSSTQTIATQTDFPLIEPAAESNISTNLNMDCSNLGNVYNLRTRRNIEYQEPRVCFLRPVENHTLLIQIITNCNTNPDEWLQTNWDITRFVEWPKKLEQTPIFIDINVVTKSLNDINVERYFNGNTKIYRINKEHFKKVPRCLNNEDFVNFLTQKTFHGDLYTEVPVSLPALPSSYTPITDNDKFFAPLFLKTLSKFEFKLISGLQKLSKDTNLILHTDDFGKYDKNLIQKLINDMLNNILESVKSGTKSPFFNVRNDTETKNFEVIENRIEMKSIADCKMKKIHLSYKNSLEKFLLMMYLLRKINELLETNTKITKRELFYQIKHLIKTQSRVDAALKEITCLLNVGQWELNIVSTHGLVYGNLNIILANNKETINCNLASTLIPFDLDAIIEIQSNAYFILIVEKESIFQKLLSEDLPNKLKVPFILITGKGHPDYNTKMFVNTLAKIMKIPVFILVDVDVHGVKIMMEYRFGCYSSGHLSKEITVPTAKWLGVFPSEIQKHNLKTTNLTDKDKKMLDAMIASPVLNAYPKIINELKIMAVSKKKASIEGLLKNQTFLSQTFLPSKFFNQNFL